MDQIDTLPRRIAWFAPWTWRRDHWVLAVPIVIAALLIVPLLYLSLVEQWTGKRRNMATIDSLLELFPRCEVCGEDAIIYYQERLASNPQAIGVRTFCDKHNREYLDAPADALKPITPLPSGFESSGP